MAIDPASSGSTAAPGGQLAEQLAVVGPNMREELAGAHRAREVSLRACRDTIRQCSLAIRAVHRLLPDQVREHSSAAEASLRVAQHALDPVSYTHLTLPTILRV